MSQLQPDRRENAERRKPPPLSLADSNHESTTPPDAAAEKSESRVADPLAVGPGESAVGDITTSGFETIFGKIVVERGLVTSEELEMANALLRESSGGSDPRTLTDVMIDSGFLTHRQITRLRNEFEANKSSQQIPGYKILKRIGSGAMATVFLAEQLSLHRPVAIKVLPKKFSDNAKFIERFYKEGRAAAQLNHPNIVQAYDVGQAGEHHYFVMEFVDGATVYDRIVKRKRFNEPEAIEIVMQVAQALKHAHERGFIHRDIKPKNIMLSKSGVVKLADLGLARALSDKEAAEAEAGRAYGTPYYISPEQIRGEVTIGPQADIYGLGATFYHMVTGRVPFEGKNPSEVMHKHLKEELTPPDHLNPKVSAGTALVIEMMMSKSRKDRYEKVDDLFEDLKLIRKGQSPHFAQKGLGMSGISSSLAVEAAQQKLAAQQPLVQAPKQSGNATSGPLFIFVMAFLLLSLLANLLLALALVT